MPRGDRIWKLQRKRRPSNSPHCAAAVVPRSAPRKAPFRLSGSLVPSTVHSFCLSLAASPKLFKIPKGVKMHLFYAIESRIPSCMFREFWIASTLLVCCSICEYTVAVLGWYKRCSLWCGPCFMLGILTFWVQCCVFWSISVGAQ